MSRALEGVKVGDTIKVQDRFSGTELHSVERVTTTRAVCGRASFMIDSGMQIGTRTTGRWPTAKYGALMRSEEEIAEVKAAIETKRRISNAQFRINRIAVTADNLEAAEAFIAASNKESEAAK